jgi:SAM-dependent MidA family methyltransferase
LAALLEVVLVEPQVGYREVQGDTLRDVWRGEVKWIDGVGELEGAEGLLVCNELLDAFAVRRVVKKGGQWMECGAALEGDGASIFWEDRAIRDEEVRAEVERLPGDLPEGFVTEVQVAVKDWVEQLGRSGFQGAVWLADYGLDAEEYWSLERPEGTLRRYWEHRMDDRVLEDLGNADLTCHVNFTVVHEAAMAAGFRVTAYEDQGRFLTRLAVPWLSSLEGRVRVGVGGALLRQFQSLTHPGIMGRSFRVMLLERVSGL